MGIGALSVLFAILPFTDVIVPTFGKGMGALSVPFAILEFTDVFVNLAASVVDYCSGVLKL
jgi:hypothetical protein